MWEEEEFISHEEVIMNELRCASIDDNGFYEEQRFINFDGILAIARSLLEKPEKFQVPHIKAVYVRKLPRGEITKDIEGLR